MADTSTVRRKRKHTKSRSGCSTCKQRRIKCTEEKPTCSRCTRSRIRCGGYHDVPKAWLFQSQSGGRRLPAAMSNSPGSVCVIFPDDSERRSFEFYMDQTVPILSAYAGHSMWAQTLPRMAQRDPLVRYLVLNIASVVESTELRVLSLADNAVYQTNHQKVVRRLTAESALGTDSVLLACLLLASCEFMMGNFSTGMIHVKAGLKILDEWWTDLKPTMATAEETRLIQ
jgi:hypothetical protein